MKAIWNTLVVPALVVTLGFYAANVQADDKPNTGSSRGSTQQAKQQTQSSGKSASGKTSSSPSNASSVKTGMNTSKQSDNSSGGIKKDNTPVSSKKTTNPKKDTTSPGSKSTSSTSKKESPTDGKKKDSDWGGYGGTGTTKDSKGKTDSKVKPSTNNKGNSSSNKKESPWGEQTGKSSKPTKTSTSDHTTKMDHCPKEMPKYKSGGRWTQEQCAPKWNACASYNKWTTCPDQWHVKFNNTYCLPTNYCFWQKKYFDARCGCYTYYDSYSSGWYYYEPVVKCYIPVSYCEQYEVERAESLEVDVCEVEVPVCETVRNYRVLPVKPACAPYTHIFRSR